MQDVKRGFILLFHVMMPWRILSLRFQRAPWRVLDARNITSIDLRYCCIYEIIVGGPNRVISVPIVLFELFRMVMCGSTWQRFMVTGFRVLRGRYFMMWTTPLYNSNSDLNYVVVKTAVVLHVFARYMVPKLLLSPMPNCFSCTVVGQSVQVKRETRHSHGHFLLALRICCVGDSKYEQT